MTVEEIFSSLATHMIQGIMIHEQLANCYGFLSLDGYKMCHEYHYQHEICNYRCLYHYFLGNYNKLLPVDDISNPSIISSNWYKYTRSDVDINTKRNAIRDLTKTWVEWEKETKTLLEKSYKELYEQNEISAALKIACFLKDVEHELKHAENKRIALETIGYDMGDIMAEQKHLCKKYKDKIACLYSHKTWQLNATRFIF